MDSREAAGQIRAMADTTRADFPAPGARHWRSAPSLTGLASSTLFIAATVGIGYAVGDPVPSGSFMLILLVAVLICAVSFGFWEGLTSAALAAVGFNFFFVEPTLTFRVNRPQDGLALTVFLIAGGLTGFLAGRLREEAVSARAHARTLELLSRFTSDLAQAGDTGVILAVALRHLQHATGGTAVLLEPNGDGSLRVTATLPAGLMLDPADIDAAERALRRKIFESGSAPGWDGFPHSFQPLLVDGSVVAIIGYSLPDRGPRAATQQDQTVQAILGQAVLAIERFRLRRQADEARTKADRESLRAALLTSLSHDLRTPLATILGSVTSLRSLGDVMPPEARTDLLEAIEEEAGRLSHYVENLLQMTRLQAGVAVRLDWIDAVEVAHAACERARRAYPGRRLMLTAGASLPLVHADAGLLEQAVFNLVDNALKFSAPAGLVEVEVADQKGVVAIHVRDDGDGIRPDERPHLFEPFFRGRTGVAAGTGLGLAICKGITDAIGASLVVQSPLASGRGTMMTIELPSTRRDDA